MQISVQILLATYNGARFLREQLDSLFNQTFQDFTIQIRDDGSTDNTVQIIEAYIQKFPNKITLLQDSFKNVGATQNFGILLENATADYIFFCDQDDIWVKHKIEKSLQKIQSLENGNSEAPCYIFTDMKAIDEAGNITDNSVWSKLLLHPDYCTLNRLLIQNIPHGCTMVINKAMRNLAVPIPKEAILHDHWMALIAAACGKSAYIEEPLVLLRNHAQNVTRKKNTLSDKLKRFSTNFWSKDQYEYFISIRVNQAKALKERVGNNITKDKLELLNKFIQLENTSGLQRKKLFLQNKFFRSTFWHTLKMIARA